MNRIALTLLALATTATAAMASTWTAYENGRYEYRIDIPPGFPPVQESGNGDGGVTSAAGVELRVWAHYVTDGDLASEAASRIEQDRADGWDVSYEKLQAEWAVWSGSRDGRIFYQRAMPVCADAIAYYRLEYDRAEASSYDAVIKRLSQSLQASGC